MKTIALRMTIIFICVSFLFWISCGKSPDEETIRAFARASDEYAQGKFAGTVEILQRQNYFPPALILRAKAQYFMGDLENAEKSCRRAIKLRPSSLEAGLYLARILRDKGDMPGAQAAAESMLADNPQDIRVLRLAAELAFNAGRFDDATILLDRAAEFSAENALVLLDRARLYWISGRWEAALEDLNRAKAMLPWDTPLLNSISGLEEIIRRVM